MTFTVPTFEPEVVEVAARRWRGDTDKVATTSLQVLTHCGVEMRSRYQKADELELMAQAVDCLSDHVAWWVLAMDCDSKHRSFGVKARCGRPGLVMIGRELSSALLALCSGHGDIALEGLAGTSHSVDPRFNHAA